MSENNQNTINFFQDKVMPAITKFTNFKFVKCMQQGITVAMGTSIIGSIFMLLMIPPFPANATGAFVEAWRAFAAANASWLNLGYTLGLNCAGLYILVGMICALCKEDDLPYGPNVVLGIFAYVCLECGLTADGGAINLQMLGAKGMMPAMIIGYLVVEFNQYLLTHGVKIKLPDSVPPFVAEPLSAMISNIIVAVVVFAIKLGLGHFGLTIGLIINKILAPIFTGTDTLTAVLVYCIVVRLLWFFGIHGNSVANAVVNPILTANAVANAELIVSGQAPKYIFNANFQNWTTTGILFIVIATMIVAKSKQLKAISKIALVPALFNIGEPLTFGLPLVLNFDIFVSYIIVFALCGAVPFLACKWGLMNIPYVGIPFTVPAIIKLFLMSMDWRALIVYLVLAVVCVLIMIPSLKKYDKRLLAEEKAAEEAQ